MAVSQTYFVALVVVTLAIALVVALHTRRVRRRRREAFEALEKEFSLRQNIRAVGGKGRK